MTIIDVDSWSKSAAKEYLTTGKPLNDSIEKIASDNGLNKDQINRVVEAANTEVYIQMFNQAQDKYVEFQSADSEKVAERLFGVEKISQAQDDDYEYAPSYTYAIQDERADAILTKVAEVKQENTTDTEALHQYYKLAALETRLKQSMDEIEVNYQHDASVLFSMVKQAVLGGASFGDVEKALTSVYEDKVVKINLNEIHEKLASELYPRAFDVEVHSVGTVNLENPLVKQAGLLLKHAQDFKNLKSKHAETTEHLKEHIKESGILSGIAKGIVKSPGVAAGSLAVGAVGGGVAVDQITKKRAEQGMMQQNMQAPNAYKR